MIGAKSEEDLGDLRTAETGRIMKAGTALAFVHVGPFLAQIFQSSGDFNAATNHWKTIIDKH